MFLACRGLLGFCEFEILHQKEIINSDMCNVTYTWKEKEGHPE